MPLIPILTSLIVLHCGKETFTYVFIIYCSITACLPTSAFDYDISPPIDLRLNEITMPSIHFTIALVIICCILSVYKDMS